MSYQGLRVKDKTFNATLQTDFDKSLSADEAGINKIDIVPQDIGRVLLNLFNNAFYSVAEKKRKTGRGYVPTISLSTKKSGSKIEIHVKDNGTGIHKKLYKKFTSLYYQANGRSHRIGIIPGL